MTLKKKRKNSAGKSPRKLFTTKLPFYLSFVIGDTITFMDLISEKQKNSKNKLIIYYKFTFYRDTRKTIKSINKFGFKQVEKLFAL